MHFQCNPDIGSDPIPMPYPREETNSSSVIFWAAAFLVVDVLWAVSALFLDGRIAGRIFNMLLFVSANLIQDTEFLLHFLLKIP